MSRFLGRTTTLTRRGARIRVAVVPADFRLPRGWPTPTDKWVRDNAFWQPPADWSPTQAGAAAPDGWEFWRPNKLWWQTTGAYYRSIAIWGRLSNWLGYLFLVMLIASAFLGSSPMLRLVGFSAGLASIALLIVHEVLKARLTERLFAQFAVVAQRGLQERLTREYQRYLTAMA
ncbi:hypothetical protein [Microbacterium sp. SS28]|uniref:hypothetical protein n=1 Tax=Microbacterium sp. SS28 TaxID=2919948 RepID=UPI001FA94A39|nr:hypothetical protein [Microbacterium sp. SS28]